MIAQMFKDNVVLPYEGLNAAMMHPEHREALLQLMTRYIGMMRDGHATAKLEEVRSHLDQTHFFWKVRRRLTPFSTTGFTARSF